MCLSSLPFYIIRVFPGEQVKSVFLVCCADECGVRGVPSQGGIIRHLHFLGSEAIEGKINLIGESGLRNNSTIVCTEIFARREYLPISPSALIGELIFITPQMFIQC